MPKKIIPHLWYDKEAKQAAEFYTSVFPNSHVTNVNSIRNTPSGDTDIVSFVLNGHQFVAISAGPYFKINPSISMMVNFDPSKDSEAKTHLDDAWKKLADGGRVLMELQEYPFSKYYGWVQDKYGLSWQLILTNPAGEDRPFILPSLMFTQKNVGRAEAAIDMYCSVFKGTRGTTARYGAGMPDDKEGTIMFADFKIMDTWMAAMDSAGPHQFVFNEAVSLLVSCDTQEEIDYYWSKLSAVPEAEQCGWLKDAYGVSWQVTPTAMGTMMSTGTPVQIDRVTKAFLQMKKFDLKKLQDAFDGK